MVGLQPIQPEDLIRSAQMLLRLLRQPENEAQMPVAGGRRLSALQQSVERVLPDRPQKPIARGLLVRLIFSVS